MAKIQPTDIDGLTTTDVPEGANLYYTQARFDTAFAAKSTTGLAEGTNLYFTDERVDDRVALLIQNGTGLSWVYNDVANTLTGTVSLAPFSTTNLAEGTNLYYTDERAQDAVGLNVDASLVYNDITPLFSRAALIGDVTAPQGSNVTTIAANAVTTAKIINGAVTYAKIQDVSATDKVLGRSTAGAGDIEEITMTAAGRALIDDADAAAQRTTLELGSTDAVVHNTLHATGPNLSSGLISAGTFIQASSNSFTEFGGISAGGASGTGVDNSSLVFYKSHGTTSAPTLLADGNPVGNFFARGYDGAAYRNCAGIRFFVDGVPAAGDMPGRITFNTSSPGTFNFSERVRIDSGGNTYFPGISTTASAANAFLDSGSTPINNLLRSTSSSKYKTNIEPLESSRADAILSLQPVWYRSKAIADRPDWSWYGLLAEEVALIEPRLVQYGYHNDDFEEFILDTDTGQTDIRLKRGAVKKPDGIAYDRLTVMLLDIVKRQQKRIEALEERLSI